jgi:NAD(P)-dependent dehydrogenase (short-subunit alcohol dehydrogenase family)
MRAMVQSTKAAVREALEKSGHSGRAIAKWPLSFSVRQDAGATGTNEGIGQEVAERSGRIYVLVNNAAIFNMTPRRHAAELGTPLPSQAEREPNGRRYNRRR